MDEFTFIDAIKQHTYKQSSIIKGVGDDAAVFRQPAQDVVTAVDVFVENVHFSRSVMTPFHIGYRALAANISDLSAMGAVPASYLVSIVIPDFWSEDELHDMYSGMAELGSAYGMDLIGGDTVSGKELTLSITAFGYVNRNKARYRSAARPGDIVFATGTLGDSAAGLFMLNNPDDYSDEAFYYRRHRMPTVNAEFASALDFLPRLALNDISDGIANEANEIAQASQVSLTIYEERLPVSSQFGQFSDEQQFKWKLFGGEDFELIGVVPKSRWADVLKAADLSQTRITKIGHVDKLGDTGPVVSLVDHRQLKRRLEQKGYTHLKQVRK
ncbi:thiamine-monophosphate kinase [Lentibacillus kapialis]|uniref:Thiamine-monophosphate kinase n=1 Tax=Lentibacillus kapialis TaxID=340214 RepID=A0A917PZ04_9BACI|nr:thiamine-phosphate kinase [Lentibacillus kapialis]GGK00831.1 thiamine-monophosphate kinase [Lentibacillus kapialis]